MRNMVIAMLLCMLCTVSVHAAEAEKRNLASSVLLYSDAIHANGKDRSEYWLKTSVKYKGRVTVGFEGAYAPGGDFTLLRPFAGPVVGPVAFIGGYSADSNNKRYAFGGARYGDRFGNIDLFVDSRGYSPLSANARPFWDTFYEGTYRIGSVRVGVNVLYDKYLDKDKANYVLAGPIVYVNVTKNIQLFGRIATDWMMTSKGTIEGTRARIGALFLF